MNYGTTNNAGYMLTSRKAYNVIQYQPGQVGWYLIVVIPPDVAGAVRRIISGLNITFLHGSKLTYKTRYVNEKQMLSNIYSMSIEPADSVDKTLMRLYYQSERCKNLHYSDYIKAQLHESIAF